MRGNQIGAMWFSIVSPASRFVASLVRVPGLTSSAEQMSSARPSECSPSAPSRPRTEATETTCREDKGASGATGTAAAGSTSRTVWEASVGAPPP